ncbi:PhzF family phenazine biosynthesis protein [Ensifer sp.]|uniref:PhzF family phenazine biosynthesis protein n=1 Tax=Ensifer sp. TaxID=1872086 RepID=UPI002896E6A6|nr:PhzF family phenazine biosynthesis protein [Ensifer sp.]
MRVPLFQIDAFTKRLFAGNPAAVMVLPSFPNNATLQAIAAENNIAETAFLVERDGQYQLRWFTPAVEVPLCGHATLASAAVVMERLEPGRKCVIFQTESGPLTVQGKEDGYVMDFPSRPCEKVATPPRMAAALNAVPVEVYRGHHSYLVVLSDAQTVRALTPDLAAIAALDRPGVIVTAAGDERYDFVSRYFSPARGNPEDPVTGAAHCMLAPYWGAITGKSTFHAYQASRRGGEVLCRLSGDRVELEGSCVFYLEGYAEI